MIRKDTDDLIAYLDSLAKLDPVAIGLLIAIRVPCNAHLAKHSKVQIHKAPHDPNQNTIGLLGILNGYAGKYTEGPFKGFGPIAALVEQSGSVSRFIKTSQEEITVAQ